MELLLVGLVAPGLVSALALAIAVIAARPRSKTPRR